MYDRIKKCFIHLFTAFEAEREMLKVEGSEIQISLICVFTININ